MLPRQRLNLMVSMLQIGAGQSRYIIFPILPHVVEEDCVVTFSAYSVIDEDRQEVTIPITVGLDAIF